MIRRATAICREDLSDNFLHKSHLTSDYGPAIVYMSALKIKNGHLLALLILLAFGIRVGMVLKFQERGLDSPPDPYMGSDHVEYNLIAKNLVQGNGYRLYNIEGPTAFRPPGTPFILAGIYKTLGVEHRNVRIVFPLIGALTLLPLFFLARYFVSDSYALLACGVLAIYPPHFYYSMQMFSETPWTFLMLCAAVSGARFFTSCHVRWGLLQGLLLGLAALTRPIALLFPVFQGALYACSILYRERKLKPVFAKAGMIFIPFLFTLLAIAPWPIRNVMVLDKFVLFSTHGGVTLYGAHNESILKMPDKIGRWIEPKYTPGNQAIKDAERISKSAADAKANELARTFIRSHLSEMPRLTVWKFVRLIHPWPGTPNQGFNIAFALTYGPLLPFIIAGFWILRKHPLALIPSSALLMIFSNAFLLYGDHRFRASIAPILVLAAIVGMSALISRWKTRTASPVNDGKNEST